MVTVSSFYIPRICLIGLESVYTDFLICQHKWQQFITRLQGEWRGFILFVSAPQLLYCRVAYASRPDRVLCC